MDILEKLRAVQSFCKLFKNRKAYLDNLASHMIAKQEAEVEKHKTALRFAQDNLATEQMKLNKYNADRAVLEKWIPENQAKYDEQEIANTDKVSHLADKIKKALNEMQNESGEGPPVL